jgi:membrane protein involved in colicin uptake
MAGDKEQSGEKPTAARTQAEMPVEVKAADAEQANKNKLAAAKSADEQAEKEAAAKKAAEKEEAEKKAAGKKDDVITRYFPSDLNLSGGSSGGIVGYTQPPGDSSGSRDD